MERAHQSLRGLGLNNQSLILNAFLGFAFGAFFRFILSLLRFAAVRLSKKLRVLVLAIFFILLIFLLLLFLLVFCHSSCFANF